MCGNGLLEPGENFMDPTRGLIGDPDGSSCAVDAQVSACTTTGQTRTFEVYFRAAIGTIPTSATMLVGYRSNLLSIPGSGSDRDVRGRVRAEPPAPFVFTPTDFDFAVRAIVIRTSPMGDGRQLTVELDTCSAGAAVASDLACTIEGCSGAGGPIDGCECEIVDPAAPTQTATATATDPPAQVTATPSPTETQTVAATATAPPTSTAAPSETPTPTSMASATATPTTAAGPLCGNGFLEPGENFMDPSLGLVGDPEGTECPSDAVVAPCAAEGGSVIFEVNFAPALGTIPTSATMLIGYRSDRLAIPGSGTSRDVRGRVSAEPPAPFVFTPNDLDYALRAIVIRTSPMEEGRQLTVEFDACSLSAPDPSDLACTIEGCSGAGGPIQGCRCKVVSPSAP